MRVLLVDSEGRAMPFAHDLLAGMADSVVTTEADDAAVASVSARGGAELVVIARCVWNDEDTELCRRLHALRLPLPLLAVSGPCDTRLRAAALRSGADDFLTVPFDVEELVARAFALLRRASSGSRHARAGAFSVDLARRQIVIEGRHLVLTLREYDVLAQLIEHAGEVVTRRELAERMAPTSAANDSNAVDVHLSRIREKLGAHGSAIETVRGLGYRLRRE